MLSVVACPKNQFDVDSASKRRNCSKDRYENNQYMCIPNKDKTSLVEFCHEGNFKLVDKGNCIEVSEDEIILHNCSHFSFGCPNVTFHYDEIHKFPTCQDINTKAHCYVSDPSCPTQASTDNLSNYNFTSTFAYLPQATTEEIKNLTESNVIHAATEEADKSAARVIVFIYIIVVLIAVIGIFCFLRRKKEKGHATRSEGNKSAELTPLMERHNEIEAIERCISADTDSTQGHEPINIRSPVKGNESDGHLPFNTRQDEMKTMDICTDTASAQDNSISETESQVISEEEENTAQDVISGPIEKQNEKFIDGICKDLIKEIKKKETTDRRNKNTETADVSKKVTETVDGECSLVEVRAHGVDTETEYGKRNFVKETMDTKGNVYKVAATGGGNAAIVSAKGCNNVVTATAIGSNNVVKATAVGENNSAIAIAEGEDNYSEALAEGTRNEAFATATGIKEQHKAIAKGIGNKAMSGEMPQSKTEKGLCDYPTGKRMEPVGKESEDEDDSEGNATDT